MLSSKRRIDPGVIQTLLSEPQRFEFFQAVRLLERLLSKSETRLDQTVARRLTFHNSMSLSFPSSEIENLEAFSTNGDPLDTPSAITHSIMMEELGEIKLTPSFIGLLGMSGALPYSYSERIAERETYFRDRAARGFLDIFTNRAVALYYAAWKKHRLALQYELDRKERFLPLVLSLAGLGFPSLRDHLNEGEGAVFDQAIAHYCGGVRQRPASVAVTQRVLADYFEVPIRIEQFVGHWYHLPKDQCSRLGSGNALLGKTALAGTRVWQRNLRVRVWIGPLNRQQFNEFLPGGARAQALSRWLGLLTGICLEYEVRLILQAEDVRGSSLGGESSVRLGLDAFMTTRPSEQSRDDARYEIHSVN
jgi:type VI secretion system protein ImpH